METVNNVGRVQTVICTLGEIPSMDEKVFCSTLYRLTEDSEMPEDVYKEALQQVNSNMAYVVADEGDPINKIRSWIDCLRFLNKYLSDEIIKQIGDVNICFEYRLKNRWVDALIMCNDKIIILEFKSGATITDAKFLEAVDQVTKYYNRMSHRNRAIVEDIETHKLTVEKYLVFTNDAVIGKVEREVFIRTKDSFSSVIDSVTSVCPRDRIDNYLDPFSFFYLSITGAFLSLITTGIVNYVKANNKNVQACYNTIKQILDQNNRELGIILVKGGPGTGKTGTAYKVLEECIRDGITSIQYVTGNNNLEKYFSRMAEAEAAKNKIYAGLQGIAESMIGHINTLYNPKNYCNVYLHRQKNVKPLAIDEDVLLVDEAQRLWNSLNIAIRSKFNGKEWVDVYTNDEQDYIYGYDLSETYLLLFGAIQGIIQQQRNKCIVLFIGNGQEINNGEENGEEDVLSAIGRIKQLATDNNVRLKVYAPEQQDFERLQKFPVDVEVIPNLMLVKNQRNDEGDPQLNIVENILKDNPDQIQNQSLYRVFNSFQVIYEALIQNNDDDDFSIGLLIDSYDTWKEGKKTVYSFTDDFARTQYKFEVEELNLVSFFHEFGCNAFQQFATEFDSQGLELDNTVVIWGNTLRWRNNRWEINDTRVNGKSRYGRIWVHCDKANKLINRVPNPEGRQPSKLLNYEEIKRKFIIGAYRVLLTRARQSSYVFVQDKDTYNHLKDLLEG